MAQKLDGMDKTLLIQAQSQLLHSMPLALHTDTQSGSCEFSHYFHPRQILDVIRFAVLFFSSFSSWIN